MILKTVGEALKVNQPAVAKLERRTDMYVSNLRTYGHGRANEHHYRISTRACGYHRLLERGRR